MNDRFHAGLAVLSSVFVGATLTVRWAVTPVREPGRHRGRRVQAVADSAVLDDLMGEWEPVYGVALEQAWQGCPCGRCPASAGAEAAS